MAQAVHADAVAEQRAARTAARRVHRQHGDPHRREVLHEAGEQLVGHRTLARAARARDADDRHLAAGDLPFLAELLELRLRDHAVFQRGEHVRDGQRVRGVERRREGTAFAVFHGAGDEVVDHPLQAHLHAVVGVVDPLDAISLQFGNFFRRDGAAAAAEDAHVARAGFAQPVDHVAEILVVPALVGADGNRVRVFLQGRVDHVGHCAVVPEVDDFRPRALDQAAHHVDGGVVAVEQRGRGHEAQRRLLGLGFGSRNDILRSRIHGAFPPGTGADRARVICCFKPSCNWRMASVASGLTSH